VWEPELVERLLKVVDRSSPRGKRDYAILLLASRLGLRLGDIRTLRLDDLKWDTAAIEIMQSKTRAPLCLPLTEEVGEALIDYLKSGRPQTAHRELFLRVQPPFTPFADDGHFYQIVKYWRELAGIRFRSKQHCGLHSLRHTLATQLLREHTPMHVISEILGHATTASTMIYAKADVESLRAAALNTEGLRHGN
jgi:integrase